MSLWDKQEAPEFQAFRKENWGRDLGGVALKAMNTEELKGQVFSIQLSKSCYVLYTFRQYLLT